MLLVVDGIVHMCVHIVHVSYSILSINHPHIYLYLENIRPYWIDKMLYDRAADGSSLYCFLLLVLFLCFLFKVSTATN